MKYYTLILGCGSYEGSKLTEFIIQREEGEGTDTPNELLTSFADAIRELVLLDCGASLEEDSPQVTSCFFCPTELVEDALFCHRCGTHKIYRETFTQVNLNEMAAVRYQDWFKKELHEFEDYEELFARGWDMASPVSGGFVRARNFDSYLISGNSEELPIDVVIGEIKVTTQE